MTNFISLLRKSVSSLDRFPAFLLIAWLVMMLSLPILRIRFGEKVLLQGWALAVFFQIALVLHVLYHAWGWWSTLRTTMGAVLLAWIIQAIVIRSGLPYGNFEYTPALEPQILGVPLLVPIVWMMMLAPAWAVAKLITQKLSGCLMRLVFVIISAVCFTSWTIFFDLFMIHFDIVKWDPVGGFYGVPWINFFGWLLVSAVITFGVSPKRIPGGLLVLVYGFTWLIDSVSLFIFWALPIPALIGFLLMGGLLLLAGIVTK